MFGNANNATTRSVIGCAQDVWKIGNLLKDLDGAVSLTSCRISVQSI